MQEKQEKNPLMLISIIAIVAIVGLFIVGLNQMKTDSIDDVTGMAGKYGRYNKEDICRFYDITYKDYLMCCGDRAGNPSCYSMERAIKNFGCEMPVCE